MRVLSAVAVLVIATSPALACEGQSGKIIFEDKFGDDMGGWTFGSQSGLTLTDAGAVLTLAGSESGRARAAQNQTFNATDGDFCAEVSFPPNSSEQPAGVGIEFLAADYFNSWLAKVTIGGKVGLYRLANKKWSTVWEVTGNVSVKSGPADVNAIRAVVKDNQITVIVNGQTIKSVRAAIPAGDLKFGIYAECQKSQSVPLDFNPKSLSSLEFSTYAERANLWGRRPQPLEFVIHSYTVTETK